MPKRWPMRVRSSTAGHALGQHGYRARIQALDLFDDPLHRIHGPQAEHHRLPGFGRLLRKPLLGVQGRRRRPLPLQRRQRLGGRQRNTGPLCPPAQETRHRRHQPARRRQGQLRGRLRVDQGRLAREARAGAVSRQPGSGVQRLHRRAADEDVPLQGPRRTPRGARNPGRGAGARPGAQQGARRDGRRARRGPHGALLRQGDPHAGRHPRGASTTSARSV